MLRNDAMNAPVRFNEAAYAFIGQLDGELSIREICENIDARNPAETPTPQEIVVILSQLLSVGALGGGVPGHIRNLLGRFQGKGQAAQKINPLAVRIPLFDPDKILNRLIVYLTPLLSRPAFIIWGLVTGFALILAITNISYLAAATSMELLNPLNLAALIVLYVIIKTVHEFAHALAIKLWGGEVHEMGITLLVFVPVPYVDASAGWVFRDRIKRVFVSAVGIMAELFMAALALFVWLTVEPGAVKDLAFNIILIASISTLLFNANPLMRFDGYYMLQDFLDIPNLSSRSSRYYFYLIQRYIYGVKEAFSPQTAAGEHYWFVIYAPLAMCYRLFIMVTIAIFLIKQFLIVGVALACWAIVSQVVMPLWRALKFLVSGQQLEEVRFRALAITVSSVTLLLLVLMLVPVSLTTRAEGVVWAPDQAQIYAATEGFVEKIYVSSGDAVEVGELLMELRNPVLLARIAVLEAQRNEITVRGRSEQFIDPVKSRIALADLESIDSELALLRSEASALTIRSEQAGRVMLADNINLQGMYLSQGQLLGYVSTGSQLIIRSVISQKDIGLLRNQVLSVEVRLAESLGEKIEARILRETPAASQELPSAALGTKGGGSIVVNTMRDDKNARLALTRVFHVDLAIAEDVNVFGLGQRAYVVFNHGSEPIASQWQRAFRQLILGQLSV